MTTRSGSPDQEASARETTALEGLLREPLDICMDSPADCLERARSIRDAYRRLDRSRLGADRVLDLKFACLHWRRVFLAHLLAHLYGGSPSWSGSNHNTLAEVIGALGIRLPETLVKRLTEQLPPQSMQRLLALQGTPSGDDPEANKLAGPGVTLNIKANRSSPWPFSRWKRNPAFGHYAFDGDGVNFRGVHFRSGDILLANVNIDGNGVYTTLSDPARFSSHAAVFAVLEDDQGRYPAVIETFEHGVRAVPLNVFLDERFSAYVEVYRHKKLKADHTRRISRTALAMLDRVRGYNFNTSEDDWDYISCCGVGRLLHIDAGLEPASLKSRIQHPRIQDNLKRLDYEYFDFFAPVDYLLDDNFECVGWIDNNQFESLLARELVESYFRELFMTRDLHPDRFPLVTRVNRWGIGHIRRQTLLGRIIGRVEGFDHVSLPKGPDPLLAVITVAEAEIGRVVGRTRRWLETLEDHSGRFSLSEFSQREQVRAYIESNLKLRWLI